MRPRYSIRGIMAAVLFVAVGFAALRFANDLWASVVFTATLLLLALACLGAAFRRGRSRAGFAGAAFLGLGYLLLAFGPWLDATFRDHLLTTKLCEAAYARLHPSREAVTLIGRPVPRLDVAAVDGRSTTADWKWTWLFTGQGPASGPAGPSTEAFQSIGHALFALLAALVGGLAARYFHATSWDGPEDARP